jgi:putative intracellular protease/amidase
MVNDDVLDWLRKVHEATTWTASVCSGALILGSGYSEGFVSHDALV